MPLGDRRASRAHALAAIALGLATITGVLAPAQLADAADDAVSAVMAGATALGDSAYYPDVAAGGNGVYHAVYRDDSLGTRIIYARSADAGRTWVRGAMLGGTIAGTRPSIAADGDHVAVGFVGEWRDANGVVNEARGRRPWRGHPPADRELDQRWRPAHGKGHAVVGRSER